MRCQKTFLLNGHCKLEAFGASQWCRWHKIIEEFRFDLSRIPKLAAQGMMLGSSGAIYAAGYCVLMYVRHGTLVWPLLAVLFVGAAAKFFADGCIAQDHPFAQFALWGKLLSVGLALEIGAGCVACYYLSVHPDEAKSVVGAVVKDPFWLKYGAVALTLAIILETASSARLFTRRVLFLRKPGLNAALTVMALLMAGGVVRPIIWASDLPTETASMRSATGDSRKADSEPTARPELPTSGTELDKRIADRFWRPVLGEAYGKPLLAVFVIGFLLAEIINKRMRARDETVAVFRATVWPSFPICFGSPFIGAAAARFVMLWTNQHNSWLFVGIALSIAALATVLGTKFVVNTYLGSLKARSERTPTNRERRQEVFLFLRTTSPVDEYNLPRRLAQTIHEIESVLTFSAVGLIEGYANQGDFFVVRMVGASADGIFGALHDLLEAADIQTGSFAVMRYGAAGQERMVEL